MKTGSDQAASRPDLNLFSFCIRDWRPKGRQDVFEKVTGDVFLALPLRAGSCFAPFLTRFLVATFFCTSARGANGKPMLTGVFYQRLLFVFRWGRRYHIGSAKADSPHERGPYGLPITPARLRRPNPGRMVNLRNAE